LPSADFIAHEAEAMKNKPTIPGPYQSEQPPAVPLATRALNFVANALGKARTQAVTGVPIYPKSGYPGWDISPLPKSINPAPEVAGLQASETAKNMLGTMLADAGIKLQPKFLELMEGVQVAPEARGQGGGYMTNQEPGGGPGRIGLPGLETSTPVGWPGPDYDVYAKRSGWVFLHESLHNLDYLLPKDQRLKIWTTMMEHWDETNPQAAQWMRVTLAGKNPSRPASEPFVDSLANYLFYPETWPKEMDTLLGDYFKVMRKGPAHKQGPDV